MTAEPTKESRADIVRSTSDAIEQTIRECSVLRIREEPTIIQAARLSHGISQLRKLLTNEMMQNLFMPLQNTKLGFLTDSKEGYSVDVVRDVLCEAFLRGFMPVNNEFNIIAGNFYGAKAGFERIVREYPGLRNFDYELAVPAMNDKGGAVVAGRASWTLDGEVHEVFWQPPSEGRPLDTRIPVKVNSGMGPDAVLGKATRKLHARVYQKLTNCSNDVVESEPETVTATGVDMSGAPEGKRISLRSKQPEPSPASPQPATRQPGED